MCFSAEADLVAGVVVSALGVDALRHVTRPSQRWLASLPVVLGVHLLVESLVWWGLQGQVPDTVWHPARWLYLAIAFGVVPVLVPIAVAANEPSWLRHRAGAFVAIGSAVAIVLMYAVVRGPVVAEIEGHHIAYDVDLWQGGAIVLLYVVVTCGSLLMSAHREFRWFGAVNLVVVGLLAWIDQSAFISLWCAWAAVTSIAIALHVRAAAAQPRRSADAALV